MEKDDHARAGYGLLHCREGGCFFEWHRPIIAHIDWDFRRVVKWADTVSRGKNDRRKTTRLARLVEGGTIGTILGRIYCRNHHVFPDPQRVSSTMKF